LKVYAHRGSMVLAPENTMRAFELALALGAHVMEIDVRLSSDNVVMVIHDESVDRTCDGSGKVRQLSYKKLRALDAGYHFTDLQGESSRAQGVRLISLEEMFELLPNTAINIDIKDNHKGAAVAVAKVIDKASRQSSVNVGSFYPQALAHFRAAAPDVSTSASQREVACLYFGRALCTNIPYQYLQIPTRYHNIPLATTGFIKHAHARGLQAVYWTINNSNAMQTLMQRGAAGIVTDRVDIACQLIHDQHEHLQGD